jgi:hypothetical protein
MSVQPSLSTERKDHAPAEEHVGSQDVDGFIIKDHKRVF